MGYKQWYFLFIIFSFHYLLLDRISMGIWRLHWRKQN